MKIKIARKGEFDWAEDMSNYIGQVHEATVRPEKEEDEFGNLLDVYDIKSGDEWREDASQWTWYSDAVEVIEE